MAEDRKQVEQLQARVCLLEALLRQVPLLWVRCRQERSLALGLPGSASHDLLKLVYTIDETMLPTEPPAGKQHRARGRAALSGVTDKP